MKRPALHILIIALAGLAVYAGTFGAPFVLDDYSSIIDNPVIKNLDAFLSGEGWRYNPRRFIGYLTLALNYRAGGLGVTGYHFVNLGIHLLNAALVYTFCRLTLRTPVLREGRLASQKGLVALVAALLFAVHPIQIQAVTYVVQRFASLATLFYLLTMVLYVLARLSQEGGKGNKAAGLLLLAFLSAGAALMSKEIAFTLPLAVALYELSFFQISWKRRLVALAPFLMLLLVLPLALRGEERSLGELLSTVDELARETDQISRSEYLFTQFPVIARYIGLILFPVGQNIDHDQTIHSTLLTPHVLLPFLFLVALLALALWLWRGEVGTTSPGEANFEGPNADMRLVGFGILFFFLALSVESSVIPIRDVMFEHRLYLPSAGLFTAVASVLVLLRERVPRQAWIAGMTVLVLGLGGATVLRNAVWGDPVSLWRDAVAKSPRKARTHSELGKVLMERKDYRAARDSFLTALRLQPGSAYIHNNLGAACQRLGMLDEAIRHYRSGLEKHPGQVESHNNLAAALMAKGRADEAIAEYRKALKLKPNSAMAHLNLGIAYHRLGRLEKAVRQYREALRLKPEYAKAHKGLGGAYMGLGRLRESAKHLRLALRLAPGDPELRPLLERVRLMGREGKGNGGPER